MSEQSTIAADGAGGSPPPTPSGIPGPPVPNTLWPVMLAVGLVSVAALAAVAVISAKGGEGSTPIIVSVLGFTASLTVGLLAVVKGQQVGQQMTALHVAVDGRLTQLLQSNTAVATAQGRATGHAQGVVDQRAGAEEERIARAVAAALQLLQSEQATATLLTASQLAASPPATVAGAPVKVILAGTTAPVPVRIAPEGEDEGGAT